MSDRIFDVDWGQVVHAASRPALSTSPTSESWNVVNPGEEVIFEGSGNIVLFQEIDLELLTLEGRVFSPQGVEVQRCWTAPIGQDWNFFPATRCYEYLYIFTAPLANDTVDAVDIEAFKDLGLDQSLGGRGTTTWDGKQIPDNAQCVFAQNTVSVNSMANAASVWNGTLVSENPLADPPVVGDPYAPLMAGEMTVVEVNRWGSLPDILGPKLYCYRVLYYPSQYMSGISGGDNPLVNATGSTARNHSTLSIKLVCKEVKLTEGEYLITAANAYNNSNQMDSNRS